MCSSTETELIAIDDALPTVHWTKNFLDDQGYNLDTIIKEDNHSAILLTEIGSCLQVKGRNTLTLDTSMLRL
jgi:hypothetical protein